MEAEVPSVSPTPVAVKTTEVDVEILGTRQVENTGPTTTATKFVPAKTKPTPPPTDRGEASNMPHFGNINFEGLLNEYNTLKLSKRKLVESLVREHKVYSFLSPYLVYQT